MACKVLHCKVKRLSKLKQNPEVGVNSRISHPLNIHSSSSYCKPCYLVLGCQGSGVWSLSPTLLSPVCAPSSWGDVKWLNRWAPGRAGLPDRHNPLKGLKEGMASHTCEAGGKIVRSWSGKEQIFKRGLQKLVSVCLLDNESGRRELYQQMNKMEP